MPRLSTYVYLNDPAGGRAVLGPDSEVPDWAIALITNPKSWAEAPEVVPDSPVEVGDVYVTSPTEALAGVQIAPAADPDGSDPASDPASDAADVRPGPDDTRAEWARFAKSLGVKVSGLSKEQLIEAADAALEASEEN